MSNTIDYDGCWSLLKPECETCNPHNMNESGERVRQGNKVVCNGTRCNISTGSKPKGDVQRLAEHKEPLKSRIALGTEFKQYGIQKLTNYGKCQLYFFLNNPGLGFQLPDVPEVDIFHTIENMPKDKTLKLVLHHINRRPWDDRKINHCLCINTEHGVIHNLYDTGRIKEAMELMRAIAVRNLDLFGISGCPEEFEPGLMEMDLDIKHI